MNRPAFTEEEYGVSTSPRVTEHRGTLRKGGGSFKLGNPYKVAGRWYVPREDPNYDRSGVGSWYGDDFHGRKTANGELFDMHALTAAHPTLPLPSYAYVTNLENGRTVLVRVNDRGPYVADRIIDLSHASARALGYAGQGKARVRVRYAGRAPLNGDDSRERRFAASQPWYRGGGVAMGASSTPAGAPYREAFAQASVEPGYQSSGAASATSWSPAAYRAGLAGKPVPRGYASAATGAVSPRPPGGVAQRNSAVSEPQTPGTFAASQGTGERLVWQASPRGVPVAAAQTSPAAAGAALAYVQVGTFDDLARAEGLRTTLGHLGPVEVAAVGAAGSPYRVRIGPMAPAEARQTLRNMNESGVRGGSIVIE